MKASVLRRVGAILLLLGSIGQLTFARGSPNMLRIAADVIAIAGILVWVFGATWTAG